MKFLLSLFFLAPYTLIAQVPMPFQLPMYPSGYFSSDTYPNGVFVIETYFESCPYCNQNAPNVDRLASRLLDRQDVQVLDVGIDRTDEQYQAWHERHQFQKNHLVLRDENRSLLSGELQTSSFPTTYVLQCDGAVLYKQVGLWGSSSRMKIEQAILKGLTKKCK